MRKEDIDAIEAYAYKYNVAFQQLKDLYELCLEIHTSGWVDGSNGYIDCGGEE